MRTSQMLREHPAPRGVAGLEECINACHVCAQTCTACADACLSEEQVDRLRRCIRHNLDCADLCETTARLLSRQTEADATLLQRQLEVLALSCQMCGQECGKHADKHEHCRTCAEVCHHCEQTCRTLLKA